MYIIECFCVFRAFPVHNNQMMNQHRNIGKSRNRLCLVFMLTYEFWLKLWLCAVPMHVLYRGYVVSRSEYTLNIALVLKFNCPVQLFSAHTYYWPMWCAFFPLHLDKCRFLSIFFIQFRFLLKISNVTAVMYAPLLYFVLHNVEIQIWKRWATTTYILYVHVNEEVSKRAITWHQ